MNVYVLAERMWEETRKLGHDIPGQWRGVPFHDLPPEVQASWVEAVMRANGMGIRW